MRHLWIGVLAMALMPAAASAGRFRTGFSFGIGAGPFVGYYGGPAYYGHGYGYGGYYRGYYGGPRYYGSVYYAPPVVYAPAPPAVVYSPPAVVYERRVVSDPPVVYDTPASSYYYDSYRTYPSSGSYRYYYGR